MAALALWRWLALAAFCGPGLVFGAATALTGDGVPFRNEQPSLAMRYLVNISGDAEDLGEVALFPTFTYARPLVWAEAQGQLLPIGQYPDLYDLLGTSFGGDGQNTFALPDLRGRTVIGAGSGPGLPSYAVGQQVGAETINDVTNVAPHGHQLGSGLMTNESGFAQTHSNLQPSLALTPIIATSGSYPPRDILTGSSSEGETPQPIGTGIDDPYLGEVTWIAHDQIPAGWAVADGSLLKISQNSALFSLLGTEYGGDGRVDFYLPDLRGRAVIGASSSSDLGVESGTPTEKLTLDKIASHTHELPYGLGPTGSAGGPQPQSNLQPSLKLTAMVAIAGRYPDIPSNATGGEPGEQGELVPAELGSGPEHYVASVAYFAGNFAPRGWMRASGQTLPIHQNTSLFSLVGTTYGGDGRNDFDLPDLTDRLAVGVGNGPGTELSTRSLGQQFGVDDSTLTIANLPAHNHAFTLAGDYNNDGRVNAADYSLWRDAVGQPAGYLSNDIDGGEIGEAQYSTWAANYGKSIQFVTPSASVPEPAAGLLACLVLALGATKSARCSGPNRR